MLFAVKTWVSKNILYKIVFDIALGQITIWSHLPNVGEVTILQLMPNFGYYCFGLPFVGI